MGKCDGKRCRKTEAVILLGLPQLTVSCLFCTTICVKTCRFIPKGWLSKSVLCSTIFSTLALLNMLSPFKTKCTTIASSPNKRFRSATTDNYSSSTTTSTKTTKTTCKFKGGITLPETNIAPENRSSQEGKACLPSINFQVQT